MPVLKRALQAFRSEPISKVETMPWAWLAFHAALVLWDCESWRLLAARQVSLAREASALVVQSAALNALSLALIRTGDFAAAATAVLYHGLGRYEEALAAAQQASEHPQKLMSTLILPELMEAAARSGHGARAAADALERLTETTRATATDWALGTEARSRALLVTNQAAEDLYRDAIDRLGRTRLRVEVARARLLYGEWLRRQRRRGEARDQLRAGYEIFVSAGAGAFAERAQTELRATGERAPKRTAQTRNALTAREAHIARLAGQGASNPEIAAQLYISPATVAYHLRKVFTTLGITSRGQLTKALPPEPD